MTDRPVHARQRTGGVSLFAINAAMRTEYIVFQRAIEQWRGNSMPPDRFQSDRVWQVRSARASVMMLVAVLTFIASMFGASGASVAQGANSPPGRLLASNCSQCHGTTDRAPGFEKLIGKRANKLYRGLKKYQSGAEGENIMARHAMGFTDAQLRDIAQWLSTQQ